jgi:predicted phosphoadenosine phosphosulfate sulfurtransferase
MFSGGKDSQTVLHLTWEIAQERGLKAVNVVFRDEELIQQSVIDFVNKYRQYPWVKMLYFAVPLYSKKYVLGRTFEYIQWDPNRRHVRPVPEWAIRLSPGDGRVFDQYTMDAFVAEHYKGKQAFVTGIRASESLMRYRASVNKLNENYLTAPFTGGAKMKTPNVMLAKPLYDWMEDDIFKYLQDAGLEYCQTYDSQLWGGQGLRVSTPLHAESAKRFHMLRLVEPQLYAQVIEIFPEMLAHERYYRDLNQEAVKLKYGQSVEGVRSWIEENITDEHEYALAVGALNTCIMLHKSDPEAYPVRAMLKHMMSGAYKRVMLPQNKTQQKRKVL